MSNELIVVEALTKAKRLGPVIQKNLMDQMLDVANGGKGSVRQIAADFVAWHDAGRLHALYEPRHGIDMSEVLVSEKG